MTKGAVPKVNEDVQQAMMLAWNRVKRGRTRQWSDWMVVGEGLLVGRKWAMRQAKANRPESRKYALAFNEWLRRWKMDDMDKSDRAKLLQIMEERLAVEEYRQNVLTKHERDTVNSPTLFWRKWRASDRRKHRPTGTRLRRTNEQLQARVAELEEERDGL